MQHTNTIKRGTELYLYGHYPVIVVQDVNYPDTIGEHLLIPCTNIIAYGDPDAEQEYLVRLPLKNLSTEQYR